MRNLNVGVGITGIGRKSVSDFGKIMTVIDSCETSAQNNVAYRMVDLYMSRELKAIEGIKWYHKKDAYAEVRKLERDIDLLRRYLDDNLLNLCRKA
jgi:hypothetical protein